MRPTDFGSAVIVANVRELRAISHSDRKSDTVDAEKIARYARLDPKILRPISHRTVAQQEAPTLIRVRNLMVRLRTAVVNSVRGLAKPAATVCQRLPPRASPTKYGRAAARSGSGTRPGSMTVKIKQYDHTIKRLTEIEYPKDAGADPGLWRRPRLQPPVQKGIHTHTPRILSIAKNADFLYRLLRTMRLPSPSRNSAIVRYGAKGLPVAIVLSRPVL